MKAVAEAVSSAATPSADRVIQAENPSMMPAVVSKAARRPPRMALRVTSAMSAPGVITSTAATPKKLRSSALLTPAL